MNRNDDIVYLETRLDSIRGRWQAMSRGARIGIVSMIFGAIGLVTCWFLAWVPYLSIPFSVLGLTLGLLASIAAFHMNRRRDAFWFPLIGLVLSGLGLAIGIANLDRSAKSDLQLQQAASQQQRQQALSKLQGRWTKNGTKQELEVTPAGMFIFFDRSSARGGEEIGSFEVQSHSTLRVEVQQTSGQFKFDFPADDRLVLSASGRRESLNGIPIGGQWKRIAANPQLTALQKEILGYQYQSTKFRRQREKVDGLLVKFETQRIELLKELKGYNNANPRDDRWNVLANELNTLVNQISLLKNRKPLLDQAIIRLDAAIANRTRKAELEGVGINLAQLKELLDTTDRLDDELKSNALSELVDGLALEEMVNQQLGSGTSPNQR